MAFDDIVRHGGVVLGHANVADVSSASSEAQKAAYKELFIGLGEVATEQCIAILNGETAQLGLREIIVHEKTETHIEFILILKTYILNIVCCYPLFYHLHQHYYR